MDSEKNKKTKKEINKILEDIYHVDETLKKHEKDLIRIVEKLLESKPDSVITKDFIERLKEEVLQNIEEKRMINIKKGGIANVFSFSRLVYTGGGVALTLILVFTFNQVNKKLNSPIDFLSREFEFQEDKATEIAFDGGIKSVTDNAFGDLNISELRDEMSRTLGAGGGGQLTKSARLISEEEKMASSSVLPHMILPSRVNYNYVYVGEELELLSEKAKVYKKIKNPLPSDKIAKSLQAFNFDSFSLKKLDNLHLDSLTLSEDKEFGLSAFLNMKDGVLSLNTNWSKWPRVDQACRDKECFDQFKLKIDDVPSDSELKKIAEDFVEKFEIDTSVYGEAEIIDHWRKTYESQEHDEFKYVPDRISVVFPLLIEGQKVYELGGDPAGLFVDVDIRHKKVAGLRQIESRAYESSNYDLISKKETIMDLLKQGGVHRNFKYDKPTETVDVKVGNPEKILLKYFKYKQEKGQSDEFFIPALSFPVLGISKEKSYFYKNNIIIPLVEGVVDMYDGPIGIPEPMPLLRSVEKSVEEGRDNEEIYITNTRLEEGELKR